MKSEECEWVAAYTPGPWRALMATLVDALAVEPEHAAPCASGSTPLASTAASSVTVQSLRESLARQSHAFVRARDMWSLLGVAADTAPSLLALWASM